MDAKAPETHHLSDGDAKIQIMITLKNVFDKVAKTIAFVAVSGSKPTFAIRATDKTMASILANPDKTETAINPLSPK